MPRILAVEDDPPTLAFLADALMAEGYEVLTVADGQAALEYLASCGADQPDAILLDLYLPLVDGAELAEAYHRLPLPHAPIVLMSASQETRAQAITVHAAGALVKPVTLDALLAELDRVVGSVGSARR